MAQPPHFLYIFCSEVLCLFSLLSLFTSIVIILCSSTIFNACKNVIIIRLAGCRISTRVRKRTVLHHLTY